jgi:hypothetical protein
MPDSLLRGACLCGAVRYEIQGPFDHALNCHCSRCRKQHGAPFVAWLAAPAVGFRWVEGEEHIARFAAPGVGDRLFCARCASSLPMPLPQTDMVVAPMGPLEGDPGIAPTLHMFAASKAPWYEITDGLPEFAEYPGSMPTPELPPVARPQPRDGVTVGSCLCGEVAYEYDGAPERMVNCHCSRCRRARCATHNTNVFVRLEQFRFTRGEPRVRDFALPGARFFGVAFCTTCGSHVPRRSEPRGIAVIPAGGLDSDPGVRPTAHIFVGSKASWHRITDGLPQFEEYPPAPA